MKTKLLLFAIGSPLLLAAAAMLAQENLSTNLATNHSTNLSVDLSTNIAAVNAGTTNAQPRKYPKALAVEQLLLPSGFKEKLKLTEAQRTELKPIEDDFANTSREYRLANQPRIDAANEANRQARAAKDQTQIQAARTQLQQVWAGLKPYRMTDVNRIKPLLTPEQLKILEDPKNQWPEDNAAETEDRSAK